MTDATIGHGTILAWSDGGAPATWTDLAEVTNISGPGMSRDTPDATHMASANGWREFVGGLKDPGEITIEANHLPGNATHDATSGVLALFAAGTRKTWRMTFPDTPATVWTFDAIVTAFEPDTPLDDKMGLSVTLKLSGEPAFV